MGWDRYKLIHTSKLQLKPHFSPWFLFSFLPSSVVPVFRNDRERSDPGKYRPISLLPIISKVFESFVNDSFTKHLDVTERKGHGLFSDLQYGFHAYQSTADILSVLSECISIRWMQVESRGLLHWISQRHLIRFGILDCSTS